MRIDEFINTLEGVKKTGGNQWTAKCPAHGDNHNSLGISVSHDKILLKCFAGCDTQSIVDALGLKISDIMPDDKEKSHIGTMTATEYKWSTLSGNDEIIHRREDYLGGKKKFIWKRNGQISKGGTPSAVKMSELALYRAHRGEISSDWLVICEGEKAAHASARMGFEAYATPGASWKPTIEAMQPVCTGRNVILWADNDSPGIKHMDAVAKLIQPFVKNCEVITTGEDKDDAADFHGSMDDVVKLALGSLTQMFCQAINASVDLDRFSTGDNGDKITTGIDALDRALGGGMEHGAMYLLGAASGGGKTTFLQCTGVHVAQNHGPVLFVSPEMSAKSLAQREIIRRSGYSKYDRAPWKKDNYSWVVERAEIAHRAAAELIASEKLPLHVIDDINVDLLQAERCARKIAGLKLVILDYAQELADDNGSTPRYLAVGEIGKRAIQLGRDMNCPVIIASQINCTKDKSGTAEYTFRESAKLEHKAHASMIIEVSREPFKNEYGIQKVIGASIIFRKNRDGAMPKIELDYKPELFSFKDKIDETDYHDDQPDNDSGGFVY